MAYVTGVVRVRRLLRFASASIAVFGLILACGSRTGLELPDDIPVTVDGSVADTRGPDAPQIDSTLPFPETGPPPITEGGPLDVVTDCPDPPVCDPNDPGYVHRCGVRIYQCSSLEQCETTCHGESCAAQCVNPCMDTLGQDTSNGCDFWAVEADVADEAAGVCFAVFVVNQWKTGEPARIQVERDGKVLPIGQFARIPVGKGTGITYAPYDANAGLPRDEIAILFLSRDPAADDDPDPGSPRRLAACPAGITPAIQADGALHGTGMGTAFHVTTNVPVVAYQILPYGGGRARVTGASLLLPTNVWDTNYVAANAFASATGITTDRAVPTLAIVAERDATHVTMAPTADLIAGGGVAGAKAGAVTTYTLNRGQYLQVSQAAELTGTPIVADAPVAVIGGSTLLDIPVTRVMRADAAEQMLPPIHALGREYVAARYRARDPGGVEESVPWRMVGVVDGTLLTYDPPQVGAPAKLLAKQLAQFDSTGPFVVRSQDDAHPFYFASYMTGGEPFDGTGDPDFVNVIAPAQYLPRYTFFTDPTYPETNLVVIRVRDTATKLFPDVDLDCFGVLGPWTPIDAAGKYQLTRVDLSTGDFAAQGACDNGVHTVAATLASGTGTPQFGVTVWGWGNAITYPPHDDTNPKSTRWVSYGYPAGANLKRLNDVVLPAR